MQDVGEWCAWKPIRCECLDGQLQWNQKGKKQPRKSAAKQAAEVIKKFEGFEPAPYLCPANVPTIGYGTTIYSDGAKVSMDDDAIDESKSRRRTAEPYQEGGEAGEWCPGCEAESTPKGCIDFIRVQCRNWKLQQINTMLRKVNHCPDDQNIPFEFRRWTKGGGKVLRGLIRRREDEVESMDRQLLIHLFRTVWPYLVTFLLGVHCCMARMWNRYQRPSQRQLKLRKPVYRTEYVDRWKTDTVRFVERVAVTDTITNTIIQEREVSED